MTSWRPGAALATVVLLATGCGVYDADVPKTESKLDNQLLDAGLFFIAECPSSVEWKPGSDFHCALVDAGGGKNNGRITVSMENDQGEFSWIRDSTG